jgi:hypothetical protein
MDRREVVNNPQEYDAPGEWGSSGAGAATPGARGSRVPTGRMRRSSGQGSSQSSGQGDPLKWTFVRPTVETIPQMPPDRFPGAPTAGGQPSPTPFPSRETTNRLMCLYLGPAGERCDRPALDNGFCPRHQPGATATTLRDESRARKKKAAATVGVVAMLWPIIEQILRAIFRLLR